MGSTTNIALQRLGIKTGIVSNRTPSLELPISRLEEDEEDDEDEDDDDSQSESSEEDFIVRHSFSKRDRNYSDRLTNEKAHWFVNFDAAILKPIFSR